jgi:hypothetical protein
MPARRKPVQSFGYTDFPVKWFRVELTSPPRDRVLAMFKPMPRTKHINLAECDGSDGAPHIQTKRALTSGYQVPTASDADGGSQVSPFF